ncbi:hypothetical protein [Paraburkholderia sp.]|uniref:hypothetical protein n=1 Tax=Paraburkholderia sp. TaxID=1926495 RepID=UPI002392E990|nr:hypothetical protein [Paraburkholderia sp.]MDE1180197.1 hypothetical protein [Paraburkholderia sp.]
MHLRRYLALLLTIAALGSTQAWASDIQCASTRQPAERVICDHAILSNEYDDIFAQQQALLSAGKLSSPQVAQWRQSRNACTDVHCIDVVFAQWKAMTRSASSLASVPPVMASSTEFAPVGPTSDAISTAAASATDAVSAAVASATSGASLVRQGSAAGVALPQPVASAASSPAGVSDAASGPRGTSGIGALGLVGLLALVALLAIGLIVFVKRRR